MSLSLWVTSLYDTAAVKNLSKEEELDMRSEEYLRHNVPPPTNIKSKLELFKHLFYFTSLLPAAVSNQGCQLL